MLALICACAAVIPATGAEEWEGAKGDWPADVEGWVPVKPGEHPRLLFRKSDLPELKRLAKIRAERAAAADPGVWGAADPGEEAGAGPAAMRRRIDHEHPLFLLCRVDNRSAAAVEQHWRACPDELKPYLALPFSGGEYLAAAKKLGIPLIAGLSRASTGQPGKDGEDRLLGAHPEVMGVSAYEYGVAEWGPSPCFPYSAEVCRKHGARVFWPFLDSFDYVIDGKWNANHLKPRFPTVYDFFRHHGRNFVLQLKINGTHYRNKKHDWESFGEFVHGSEGMIGCWLTGLVDVWGMHPENWIWYEKGYTRLFHYTEPVSRDRWGRDWHGVIQNACPEMLLGQHVFLALIRGCTVISVEEGLLGGHRGSDNLNPWFDGAYWPVWKEVVTRKLIPSREEMRRRVRVATDGSFQRLYANTACALQHDGRYGLVAWLPAGTPDEERRRFEFLPGDYDARYLPFLNALYPLEGRGRSFIERRGRFWFLMNPWENIDKETDFQLPLYTNGCASLSGTMRPHIVGIVEEHPDRIEAFFHNFRLDKDIWGRRRQCFNNARGIQAVVDAAWAAAPRQMRKTSLVLAGHTGPEPPRLSIEGHKGFRHEARWRAAERRYELDIHHNGTVRLTLHATGNEKDKRPPRALSSNLALDRNVPAGSEAPANAGAPAVDGLVHTAWVPADRKKAWLTLDLGKAFEVSAYKVVPARAASPSPLAFRVQTAAALQGPWQTVHRGRCVDGFLRAFALKQVKPVRFLRLVIENPSPGQGVAEWGIYSGPAQALEKWAPLAEADDLGALSGLLQEAGSDTERRAVGDALIRAYRKEGSDRARAITFLCDSFSKADEPAGAQLVRVLGRLADDRAVATLRRAAADRRPEVRESAEWALADWPHGSALPDVIRLARTAPDGSLREHAIRSTARFIEKGMEAGPAGGAGPLPDLFPLAGEQRTKLDCIRVLAKAPGAKSFRALATRLDDWDSHRAAAAARRACKEMAPKLPSDTVQKALIPLKRKHADDPRFLSRLLNDFPPAKPKSPQAP